MALHQQPTLGQYARLLETNPEEILSLYRDMLINVTPTARRRLL